MDLQANLEKGNIGTVAYLMRKKLQNDLELILKEKGLEDPEVLITYELTLKSTADDTMYIEIRDWKEDDTAKVLKFESVSIDMFFRDRMMEVAIELLEKGVENVFENKLKWAGINSPKIKEV